MNGYLILMHVSNVSITLECKVNKYYNNLLFPIHIQIWNL